ncbi:hypothetical protein C9374_001323 [Naegleria lovaniensis]|uniref:Uncharacterized protein n=1 Tax=Naegleria lovaniensis TaxID=51637 RepID=A0AA88KN78_NAELO|nr:uncharacterized protein C9374_001323 [Naegleria lovaniensis]KAG2387729.1 hypothetical protein C9374_001323 [Naegleria lovaniensis]
MKDNQEEDPAFWDLFYAESPRARSHDYFFQEDEDSIFEAINYFTDSPALWEFWNEHILKEQDKNTMVPFPCSPTQAWVVCPFIANVEFSSDSSNSTSNTFHEPEPWQIETFCALSGLLPYGNQHDSIQVSEASEHFNRHLTQHVLAALQASSETKVNHLTHLCKQRIMRPLVPKHSFQILSSKRNMNTMIEIKLVTKQNSNSNQQIKLKYLVNDDHVGTWNHVNSNSFKIRAKDTFNKKSKGKYVLLIQTLDSEQFRVEFNCSRLEKTKSNSKKCFAGLPVNSIEIVHLICGGHDGKTATQLVTYTFEPELGK